MVILLIFTFCVELCIMGQRRAFQLVIDGDQLPVGLYFADLRGNPRLIILIHESMSLLSKCCTNSNVSLFQILLYEKRHVFWQFFKSGDIQESILIDPLDVLFI